MIYDLKRRANDKDAQSKMLKNWLREKDKQKVNETSRQYVDKYQVSLEDPAPHTNRNQRGQCCI